MNKNNTIQFLECYEMHPCLWNPREQDYRNNNVRLAAPKSIIQEMRLSITVEEVKLKVKNIRTTYNREASKVAKSKKSGAGEDDVYRPQLIWFSVADRFLKPVIEGRNSKDNMVSLIIIYSIVILVRML
ncbi:unnamed protein product [Euphydryas editha]|uniref:MADF domain-containing protein n=1 Tax=Euphydryas editha TaxID=104508 RepID=A0AAU9U5W3_EUPED|nr:unnamed protein product [Euphydryas editha]